MVKAESLQVMVVMSCSGNDSHQSSFPDDYHAKTDKIGKYMIGMSVPPKMTEQVARAVCEQWLNVNYSELSNDNQAQNPHWFEAGRIIGG